MTHSLRASWSAFSPSLAASYLKTRGAPSIGSKEVVADVLADLGGSPTSILDLGCGNAHLYGYLTERGLKCHYTGVDFSDALLAAARAEYSDDAGVRLIVDDIETLGSLDERFDAVVYSHVLECVESPERTLVRAAQLAPVIVIRFFEPPANVPDVVELRSMEVDDGLTVPYLRRSMSDDYYRLLLTKINCSQVDVYQDPSGAKDQVHVLGIG